MRAIRRCGVTLWAVAAVVLLAPAPAVAQTTTVQIRKLATPRSTAPAPSLPGAGSPGATIVTPNPLAPAPPAQSEPLVPAGRVALAVAARYGRDAPLISGGLIWRVYAAKPDAAGMFRLIKEDRAASPTFVLPPGNYVVAREPRARQRRQGGPAARRDGARSVRYSRGRHAARGPRRRRAHPDRTNFVRNLYAAASSTTAERRPHRAERDDGRRRAAAGGHLLHRVELRRRQFGGALRREGPGRQAHRYRGHPSRRGHHAQARQRIRAARRSPIRSGRC